MPEPSTSSRPSAVLYICVDRRQDSSGLAVMRAVSEGHGFADQRDLRIVTQITDPYGEPVPQKRSGWCQVRELAERGEISVVITRWPSALSPDHELRYPELYHLGRHGTQVLFSWAPLAATANGDAALMGGRHPRATQPHRGPAYYRNHTKHRNGDDRGGDTCAECAHLRSELAAAEEAQDRARVVDCRVLLRRHPLHDDVPVPARFPLQGS